ncbi:galactinol--sucrose galactosyltransferase 2 [Pyrus ussuriensis x Pyrus communis]|uniref:Galactinol--sucrose galactosyltransferase 2 n=1 Tax=Pyrus ussuriensis x Pyrus communis TaxID=2448454 RepID=A0A5N5FC25_9ROSA|nr:galactinol--sucrose galactosyltransferase 2 [Pyrus ussuriensis x Pyrus communis]
MYHISYFHGDSAVQTNQGQCLVYMNSGTNPFEVITQAVKAVEKHMKTFVHREKKKIENKDKDSGVVVQGAQ